MSLAESTWHGEGAAEEAGGGCIPWGKLNLSEQAGPRELREEATSRLHQRLM